MDHDVIDRLLGMLFPALDLLLTWMIVGVSIVFVSLENDGWFTAAVLSPDQLFNEWLRIILTWPIALGPLGSMGAFVLIIPCLFRIGAIG